MSNDTPCARRRPLLVLPSGMLATCVVIDENSGEELEIGSFITCSPICDRSAEILSCSWDRLYSETRVSVYIIILSSLRRNLSWPGGSSRSPNHPVGQQLECFSSPVCWIPSWTPYTSAWPRQDTCANCFSIVVDVLYLSTSAPAVS